MLLTETQTTCILLRTILRGLGMSSSRYSLAILSLLLTFGTLVAACTSSAQAPPPTAAPNTGAAPDPTLQALERQNAELQATLTARQNQAQVAAAQQTETALQTAVAQKPTTVSKVTSQPAQNTPQDATTRFVQALMQGDYDTALAMIPEYVQSGQSTRWRQLVSAHSTALRGCNNTRIKWVNQQPVAGRNQISGIFTTPYGSYNPLSQFLVSKPDSRLVHSIHVTTQSVSGEWKVVDFGIAPAG
jgi:hypothetical protein